MSIYTAVVVGINYDKYPEAVDSRWQPLRYAEADAQEMASDLTSFGYSVELLLGARATRQAVLEAVVRQRKAAGGEGLFLLHFAGHGSLEAGIAYMIPIDAQDGLFESTAIRMEDIVSRHLTDVEKGVALLDCCYSGDAVGLREASEHEADSRAFVNQVQQVLDRVGRGRAVLTACAGSELAHEPKELRHGAFTYFALKHFRDHQALVTTNTLFESIDEGLQSMGLPAPVQGGNHQGRIILRPALVSLDEAEPASEGVSSWEQGDPMTNKGEAQDALEEDKISVEHLSDDSDAEIENRILEFLLPQLESALRLGNREEIINLADRVLRVDRNHQPTKTLARDAHVLRGRRYLQSNQHGAAVTDFSRAIELDPLNPGHYYERALVHMQMGQYEFSTADITQAIDLHDNPPSQYYYHRGVSRHNSANYDDAISDLRRAIRLDSLIAEYHKMLGLVYRANGDSAKANRSFELAVSLGDASAAREIRD